MSDSNPFDSVDEAIAEIAAGNLIIVTDDEDRENEGDLIMAASKVSAEKVNMMIRYGSGIVCVPALEPQLKRLGLGPMVSHNRESQRTDYTVTVDAAEGITTGISAHDRAEAIKILGNSNARADELVQPGHIFPLRARPGGVLERAGHTEAAVDLASLAGLFPAGVICEIVNEDGTMARLPELIKFKEKFGLKLISIAQLIEYRHKQEKLVEEVLTQSFESEFGDFELHVFKSCLDNSYSFALTKGELTKDATMVRVHSANILTDIFAAKDALHRGAARKALEKISKEESGVLLYMTHPTGGVQIDDASNSPKKVKAARMDFRSYGIGAQILSNLGLKKIKLLTSSQRHIVALDGYGLEIVEQIPLD